MGVEAGTFFPLSKKEKLVCLIYSVRAVGLDWAATTQILGNEAARCCAQRACPPPTWIEPRAHDGSRPSRRLGEHQRGSGFLGSSPPPPDCPKPHRDRELPTLTAGSPTPRLAPLHAVYSRHLWGHSSYFLCQYFDVD